MGAPEVIRLSLLGTPRLDGASQGGQSVLAQQKRLALLAYLAVRHEFVRRDDLIALFWADLEEKSGRGALSQGLHFLRRALGPHVIVNRGTEEVRLSPDVRVDTAAFETALSERRLDDALGIYRGELLQGLNGGVSPEFSFWLDAERARLHRLAAEAACTRSDQCFRAGDLPAAIRWQRRALELRSTDEVTLRNYLALLDEIGDGGTAVAAYEAFRDRLEQAFQLEPSRETVRLVDQIRARRPESPTAPVTRTLTLQNSASTLTIPAGPAEEGQRFATVESVGRTHWFRRALRPLTRRVPLALIFLTVVAAAMVWGQPPSHNAAGVNVPDVPDPNRVAVMYLDVRGDTAELGYLADGITEDLISNLSTIPTIDVISPNGVRRYRRKAFEPDSLFAKLNAGSLITGVVSGTRQRASVTVNIENRASVVLAPIRIDITGDIPEAINTITEEIVRQLGPVLNEAMDYDRMRAATTNDLAWEHVAKARQKWRLFDYFTTNGPFRHARQTADDADKLLAAAIALDDKWISPHIVRGDFALGLAWACIHEDGCSPKEYLEQARQFADEAEKLSPRNSLALELKGQALYYQWIFGASDGDVRVLNAAESTLVAAASDPSRATALNLLSAIYLGKSEYKQAATAAFNALEADAFHEDRIEILITLFRANFHMGDHVRARKACDDLRASSNQAAQWPTLYCTVSLQAWSDLVKPDPDASLQALQHKFPDERVNGWLEIMVAAVLARDGQTERARSMIENALVNAHRLNDSEAAHFAAAAMTRLGDLDRARELLDTYVDEKRAEREHVRKEFWFRELSSPDPLVRQLHDPPRR
jgi:DNA-binding SARP family transcriptional activator/TolB-like protein